MLGEDEFCVTPHMGGPWSPQSHTDRQWNGGCQGRGLGRETGIGALWGQFQCGNLRKFWRRMGVVECTQATELGT